MKQSIPKLGIVESTAVVLGSIVGVMIFLTQSTVAKHLPWDGWFLAAWALGGLLALFGALSLGELGAMMPEAGGDYHYLREAFGENVAFLSGWTSTVITFPGSIAAMAVGLCYFQAPALLGKWLQEPLLTWNLGWFVYKLNYAQLLSLGVVLSLTTINHVGLKLTGWLQTTLTVLPVLLMLTAGVAIFFVTPTGGKLATVSTSHASPWLGLAAAIVPIFFAYAGWNATTYIGSEIKNPGRNIPLSLIVGTCISIAVYLVVSWVFLQGVPANAMPKAGFVPYTAVNRLFGPQAGHLLTLVIALAVLGSLNATILAGARISYAMSQHGLAFPSLQQRSARFKTPAYALWFQAAVAMVLVFSGQFDQLVKYVTGVMLAFSCITVAAVFVLRYKRPNAPRPYRTWGYPVVPAVYILFSAVVLVVLCVRSPAEVGWGVLITALGIPVLASLRRSNTQTKGLAKQA